MGAGRKRNYLRSLQRTAPDVEATGHTFLIVVEGEVVEQEYFEGLRARLQFKAVDVVVHHPEATDPRNLVKAAIALKEKRAERAGKSEIVSAYDEVWVVLDREAQNHPRGKQLSEARQMAEDNGIVLAVSNPSIEFWLLLHFLTHPTTKPFADGDAVVKALKKHIPKYSKKKSSLPLDELLFAEKLKAAIKHAGHCRKHHETPGCDGNPSTDVDLLVSALNLAVAPIHRLV